ncbi:MAG: CBS domain-containing protein [Elusimicrobiota bacterium]
MKVKDLMTRGVEVADKHFSLTEASVEMKRYDIGFLPVTNADKVLGVLTDRDIVVRGLAEGKDPEKTKVTDIMTQDIEWISDGATVNQAVKLMEKTKKRRLLVMNEQRKLIGIVSLGDIAVKSRNKDLAGEVLEDISEPARPAR